MLTALLMILVLLVAVILIGAACAAFGDGSFFSTLLLMNAIENIFKIVGFLLQAMSDSSK
jgi:hypothetical protein